MLISEQLKAKVQTTSFEVFPPKNDAAYAPVEAAVDRLSEFRPDFISVTYGAGGGTSVNTPKIASHIQNDLKIPALAHLTCASSTKAQIHEIVLDLKARGIQNILALRGDLPENYQPDNDHYRYAGELVTAIREIGGFSVGAACYPEGHPECTDILTDIRNLKIKVDAGVSHLNTQLFFDNDDFYRFRDMIALAGIDVPVQAGIMPLVKKSHIDRIITLSGAKIPAKISRMISRFYDKPDSLMEAGIAYATDQIVDLLSAGVRGVHLYVMNNAYVARRITESIAPILRELNGN